MRLKNKISIAFSIAKWNRLESLWQQGKEENKKKYATERHSPFNRISQSHFVFVSAYFSVGRR